MDVDKPVLVYGRDGAFWQLSQKRTRDDHRSGFTFFDESISNAGPLVTYDLGS